MDQTKTKMVIDYNLLVETAMEIKDASRRFNALSQLVVLDSETKDKLDKAVKNENLIELYQVISDINANSKLPVKRVEALLKPALSILAAKQSEEREQKLAILEQTIGGKTK